MDMKNVLLCLSVMLWGGISQVYSEDVISVFRTFKTPVRVPVLNDTVDVKNKKIDEAAILMKTQVPVLFDRECADTICADTSGFVSFPIPEKTGMLYLLNFNIRSDRFLQGKLKFTTPSRIEVYVNGEKKSEKTAIQDKRDDSGVCETALRMEPEVTYEITVKLLSRPEDKSASALKTAFVKEKKDSSAQVVWGPSIQKRYLLPNTVFGNRVTNVSISPSGKYLLTFYRDYHSLDRSESYIILSETETGDTIARFDTGKSGLAWMPRSEKLYYTVTAAVGRNIRTINPATMEDCLLAESIPDGSFSWSPDETALFYFPNEEIPSDAGPLKRINHPDDRVPGSKNRWFISRYDLLTRVNERLTSGTQSTSLMDVSRDGKWVLFSSSKRLITQRPFRLGSLYCMNLETWVVDTLIKEEPFLGDAHFSPDGTQIVLTASPEAFNKIGKNCGKEPIANDYDKQAFIMNRSTKEITPITRDFAPSVNFLQWNSQDECIYFSTADEDCRHIYRYHPHKKSFELLPLNGDVITRFSLASEGLQASYIGISASSSTQSYLYDVKKKRSELLSSPMKETLDEIALGEVEEWSFQTADGTRIKGFKCLPPDFDSNKKYPLIVYYYGGTTPTERSMENTYAAQLFASRNYVVYVINPSGTIGFGQEFSARHVNAWGKRTADEIIEGTRRFCEAHPFVDSTRIGCLGASYGGFMTQYLQTKTKLFAAAVSHAGISNVTSYWGEGYWGYSYNSVAAAESQPWNNPDLYTRQGSLFNADKITTPLLLLHGTVDTNVPIGESIQLYNALKLLGRTVEFIQVEGENHYIADYPKRLLWQNSIMAWFARWLQGDDSWWNDLYPERVNK